MRFLPPGPNSTGSIAAQPAPAGGRFGLFRAASTQGNCLPLGWANIRVQNNRKCSKGGRCQDSHHGERGLAEPKVFIQFIEKNPQSCSGGQGGERGTGLSPPFSPQRLLTNPWVPGTFMTREGEREREVDFKALAHTNIKAGESKICRVDLGDQAGDPENSFGSSPKTRSTTGHIPSSSGAVFFSIKAFN